MKMNQSSIAASEENPELTAMSQAFFFIKRACYPFPALGDL